jgi:outer membrane protein assembly factor BamB
MVLDGKNDTTTGKRSLKISTWDAMPRLSKSVPFEWEPDVWYRAKFAVQNGSVRGKVWKKGEAEPAEWTISFEDPSPNKTGAAGIFGYVSNIPGEGQPGSDIYYDNLSIQPNK